MTIDNEICKYNDIFNGLFSMEVTAEAVSKIADAEFAWLDLIVQGHMIAICAKPNGGKTTIMVHAAGEMASKNGYQVIYINADAAASDLKHYKKHAGDFGYKLLSPDLANEAPEKVIHELKKLAIGNHNLSGHVLILDTLKKFTDMMCKKRGKELYSILRALTTKGMTIICLAHTNKYNDNDGKPIFEGVGDLRSDFDELIYLIPCKNEDGSMTVSTAIDKCRAVLQECSFNISANRDVHVLNKYVDTVAASHLQEKLKDDDDVIQFISNNIELQSKSVTELYELARGSGLHLSRKRIDSVLKRYSDVSSSSPKWSTSPAPTNGIKYGLIASNHSNKLSN